MTTIDIHSGLEGPSDRPVAAPLRSYAARVALDTLGRRGAQLGVAWVSLLALLAVFAPLLASSHPILIKMDGEWSSPMFRHLSIVDVALLAAACLAVLLLACLRRPAFRVRFWVWVGATVIATVLAWQFVAPPRAVVLSQYREAGVKGHVEFVMHTFVPYSPTDRLRDRGEMRLRPPDFTHLMGTTVNGEDMLSRMIHAARIALTIGFIATGIALLIGVTIGGIMGYFSGWVDLFGMRLVEVFSAIPTIYLLIAIVAFYGRNLYLMMVVIGLTSWVGYALFTRAEFLRLRKQDFVAAARACGLPLRSILFRHMLPNGIAPVLVSASFGVASAILFESTLSFLGLGLVEEPSWGQLLNQARGVGGSFYWWIAIFPGLAIFLTVFAYNMVGEALRDAIDPHMKRQAQL